jgi:hypothetical protein
VGQRIDLYAWTRKLALRIAMRALFGLDPDGPTARSMDAARLFNQALHFYSYDIVVQWFRGPGTPWNAMMNARRELDRLIYSEIDSRRRTGERGLDLLSLLLDASDEDGATLQDRHIRDEVMTLLFAGHDTTTSTIGFMFYELARHPEIAAALRDEQVRVLGEQVPDARALMSGQLELLEMVQDETLRMYPPAWIGARRSIEPFEFAGSDGAGWRVRELQVVGLAPSPARVPRTRAVPSGTVRAGREGDAAEGRLRAIRRRFPDLHRDALRPAGSESDRYCASAALHVRTGGGLPAANPADAHDRAARWGAADSSPPQSPPSPLGPVAA